MNKYLKLVNFELNRFIKVYAALLAITILSQLAAIILVSKKYVNEASKTMTQLEITKAEFIVQNGKLYFTDIMRSLWYMAPIALSAVVLILYIFLIWYRDWFGKNTFIYRLLMLPTARINIYFAKATTILLFVFGLVALQILLLPIENSIYSEIVPDGMKNGAASLKDLIFSNEMLRLIIPNTFTQFLLYYGAGIMAVFIIFTAILMERSYRIKGAILAIIYCVAAAAVMIIPDYISGTDILYLYPIELLGLKVLLGVLISTVSIFVGNHLINKKVMV
ncbi:hypothetical protein [Peribacillus sp. SCS-155]|uniref:hypothetical protein n=1 Tax=Peribacillus sedimenti TaxID=3115297 RepID=UPI003905B6A0